MRMMLTALALLAAMLANAPARAGQVCTDTCDEYNQGRCVLTRHTCTYTPPPPAYGAIAYGRSSGAWGTSYHWSSRAQAERVALRNCAPHGTDCEIMAWFRNECGAVATGTGDSAYWGIGDGIGAARGSALQKCERGGGGQCTIAVSECSR
ncbi:MAG: DUF4189 domain-containing protein [Rhodospirillales bacterium]|nr:DUF4189 domain-containing protein [Rhodospirillales bacterium]